MPWEGFVKPNSIMALLDFQQRVVDEKTELDEKINKLGVFLNSEVFDGLAKRDQFMLVEQRACMKSYSRILGDRIALFRPTEA